MASSKLKAIVTTQRKDRKSDDSGEGERIFRMQMSHYLTFYSTSVGIEDPLNVNDFLGLLHSVRATRRWKKRGQQLLTHLHQISPPAENEPIEHTLVNHYYRACFFWHYFYVDRTEKPASLGVAVSKAAASVMKPARYFFQQLVSAKVLRRQKHSTFDLARPLVTAFATALQMIAEIIKSDKLLEETVWNYEGFINAVNGCVSYRSLCRRATWVLRLHRLVSGTPPIQKTITRRQQRTHSVRKTRRHRKPDDTDGPNSD